MTKEQIIELLKGTLGWHKNEPKSNRPMPDEWCDGFIAGIEHAIKTIEKVQVNPSRIIN